MTVPFPRPKTAPKTLDDAEVMICDLDDAWREAGRPASWPDSYDAVLEVCKPKLRAKLRKLFDLE